MKRVLASFRFLYPAESIRFALCLFLTLSPQLVSAATGYLVHNLVADATTTATADFYDPRLVNPWGIAPNGQMWLCAFGVSPLYAVNAANATPMGNPNATTHPTVPGAGGTLGSCTGIVGGIPATTPPSFPVTAPGKSPVAASFIFVSEDGVLSAWANGADATQALVEVDNSSTAVYKGLAVVPPPAVPAVRLYAANFKAGTIDVFDAQFKPVTLTGSLFGPTPFTDSKIPAGFAPFNIQAIGGNLYVTYAKQNAAKFFDVPGVGNGYVDIYDPNGTLLKSFFGGPGSPLNSPWGVAVAPATFGKFANDLLVGNFGDGMINAFDPTTGALVGPLQDASGKNIVIPGLWALTFGRNVTPATGNVGDPDTLYFTAGPGGQKHGLLGSISANPNILSADVTNAAQPTGGIAPNSFIMIKGNNLAPTKRLWATADFGGTGKAMPTSLDGISVTVNGQATYIYYISPVQINLITPTDLPVSGQLAVQISDNTLTSNTVNVTSQPVAPAFFLLDAAGHAATHLNYSPVTAASPAAPNEVILLFGNGFGATNPPPVNGQVLAAPASMVVNPVITFNGINATVVAAGLISPALYQFNVRVPAGLPNDDVKVSATAGGVTTPAGALVTIKN